MQGKIITISRQCGSGGHSIGSELAKRLDVPFYDREIIEMAAKESEFHQGFVEEKEEHMNSSLLFNIARYASYGGRGRYEDYQPLAGSALFRAGKGHKRSCGERPLCHSRQMRGLYPAGQKRCIEYLYPCGYGI